MKIVAIIQARMGSTRLPGKVLADVAGVPLVMRVVQRVRAVSSIDCCVVATTVSSEDDALVQFLADHGVAAFRGSADDVLDRYYQCAQHYLADIVVRVTADDPLKDPAIVARAISLLTSDLSIDYCSNTLEPTFPEGLDIEVFRRTALARAWKEAVLPSEREHVTPYIWKHTELFRLVNFRAERNLADWRWTVDRQPDLELVRAIYTHFYNTPLVSYCEIVAWLEANPSVRRLNAEFMRNEGYIKSLEDEQSE